MLPQEIEIKLDLQQEENYNKLIKRFRIKENPTRQENYFFDSEIMSLSKSGWALRLRIEENKSSLTLKGTTAHASNGLAVRDEIEIPIPDDTARKYAEDGLRSGNIPNEIALIIRPIVNLSDLVLRVQFLNDRSRVLYTGGDMDLLFEIDKTEFADGTIEYELEVELENQLSYQKALGAITVFFDSIQIVMVFQKQSKLARALKRESMAE